MKIITDSLQKNVKYVLLIIGVIGYLGVGFFLTRNFSLSERFGDETAHWIGGSQVLHGKVLYKDLQFNHQPLPYLFSTLVESLTHPDNLFHYISYQRLAILVYDVMWSSLLVLVFGPWLIVFILLLEIYKYFYDGYKLLAETLAAYPTVFLFSLLLDNTLFKKELNNQKLILSSIAAWIAGFSLLPLWIVVVPIQIIFFYQHRNVRRFLLFQLLPGVILTVILFLLVPPIGLFQQTIVENITYFVPVSSSHPPTIATLLVFPFRSLFPPYEGIQGMIAILFATTLISGYFFAQQKKARVWVGIMLLFMLTNFFRADGRHYSNFHLFPWFGTLLVIAMYFMFYLIKSKKPRMQIFAKGLALAVCIIIIISISGAENIWQKRDRLHEFYIHYSPSETNGNAIKVLKDKNDQLLVAPDDPLIYWVTDIDSPVSPLEFFPWIYPIPRYREELVTIFKENPPEFFVNTGLNKSNDLELFMLNNLRKNYIRLNHVGKPSDIYVLKDKIPEISPHQKSALKELLFEIP